MIKSHTVIVGVGFAALMTAGVAITASQLVNAATNQGSGTASAKATPKPSKSATAEPPPKALVLGGSLAVAGLAPGVSVTRTLTILNDNNQDVVLNSVQTSLYGPTPGPTSGTCTSPADFEVLVAGYNVTTGAGSPVTIKRNSSAGLPVTVRMNNSTNRNQDACKSKSWTFTFAATATSK